MTAPALDYSTLLLAAQDPQGYAAYCRMERTFARRMARRAAVARLMDRARALLRLTPRR